MTTYTDQFTRADVLNQAREAGRQEMWWSIYDAIDARAGEFDKEGWKATQQILAESRPKPPSTDQDEPPKHFCATCWRWHRSKESARLCLASHEKGGGR